VFQLNDKRNASDFRADFAIVSFAETNEPASSQMYTYRISGLTVRAEMELPGVSPAPADNVDVHIRQRPVPEFLEEPTMHGTVWELNERNFLLRLPDIGRFLACGGHTLDVEPAEGTNLADAMPFLLGTGFGALLLQRGGLVLHAASVATGGRAYVFCGQSGMGKSTLAAALCRAGCRFVNDDICAVGADETGRPVLWPDGRRLKLFENSIAYLNLDAQRREVVRAGIGKHYVEPPAPAVSAPDIGAAAKLAAIYILGDQTLPDEAGIEQLSPLNAAQALLDQSYRRRLAMARRNREVAATAAILRHVPVFHLTRRRGLDRLADTVNDLQAHWRELSLQADADSAWRPRVARLLPAIRQHVDASSAVESDGGHGRSGGHQQAVPPGQHRLLPRDFRRRDAR
jgi:hypothetical protein